MYDKSLHKGNTNFYLLQKLHQCESKIFTLQNEIDCMKPKLAEKSQLKSEIERLIKELVIMGELNQHHKDMMEKAAVDKGKKPEASLQFYACQKELTASKQMVRKQKTEIEALHSKVAELEKHLTKKDVEMKEFRKFSESLNGIYLAKHKALEEKYTAQKKINQTLEARILNLQLALEDTKHENTMQAAAKTKTRATSPIQEETSSG
ncbi:hamartin-like [Actinia tenebrosa]|uniref:Hamartin-like n=1 Tax=Actinia tenebrosa TaxID=6105 RepID=A0A6P8IG99_ACTTE|nr:hamartin-like [Actinia tenebrosa]